MLRSAFLGTVALLLLSLPAGGEPVVVDAIQKRDRPFVIDHESGETIQAVFVNSSGDWSYLPDEHFIREDSRTFMAAPRGRYLIVTNRAKIIEIIDEGSPDPKPDPKPEPRPEPRPEPDPDPKPEPEPGPDPDDQKIRASWIVFVEENDDRANHQMESNTMRDSELWDLFDDLGVSWRIYDKDQAKAGKYLDSAKQRGVSLPAMFIIQDEKNYKVLKAPMSVPEAEKLIRENITR